MCNESLLELCSQYNSVMSDPKNALSKANAVAIMVFLYEQGGSSKATYIQSGLSMNYNSVKNCCSSLVKENLMTETEHMGKSRYILYELTPLGLDVAADLKRANDRILGIPPESSTNCGSSEEKMDSVTEE